MVDMISIEVIEDTQRPSGFEACIGDFQQFLGEDIRFSADDKMVLAIDKVGAAENLG